MVNRFLIILIVLFVSVASVFSQTVIELKNPSFEDSPRKGGSVSMPIAGWHDCGMSNFPGESPPDIHPVMDHAWEVIKPAKEGKTYLGLVTRYNDTYESVSQALATPLEQGKCYSITAYLAKSENYKSPTPRSGNIESGSRSNPVRKQVLENFIEPVELLIWGGKFYCERGQLLAHSGPVSETEWTSYTLKFKADDTYKYIILGAFFKHGYSAPYNGHLLIDALSPITEIPCDE